MCDISTFMLSAQVTAGETDFDATNPRTFRPIANCRKNAGLEKSSQGSRYPKILNVHWSSAVQRVQSGQTASWIGRPLNLIPLKSIQLGPGSTSSWEPSGSLRRCCAHDVLRPALAQSDLYNILGMGLIYISFVLNHGANSNCCSQIVAVLALIFTTGTVWSMNSF
ncbi:hypothetical protein B0H14DRAFT_2582085 [Mycena olivaceomarginata]|nr:hypothetical protein B0H14DRAFT_2582085 [Mycena olivaceomarginata]